MLLCRGYFPSMSSTTPQHKILYFHYISLGTGEVCWSDFEEDNSYSDDEILQLMCKCNPVSPRTEIQVRPSQQKHQYT